jgi:hypothetical protein
MAFDRGLSSVARRLYRATLTIAPSALLWAQTTYAAPTSDAAEASRVLADTCSTLASPTAREEVATKNELATMLWSSRVGAKLRVAAEVQAVGQMLRDLAASNYNWTGLDATAQIAEFRTKWVPAYKLPPVLADGIVKLSTDQRTPILSGLLVLPCGGEQRKPVPIPWVRQQRPDRQAVASAHVPGATVTFVEFKSGFQNFTFQLDDGNICMGSGQALKQMFMICGAQGARYELSRKEGETAFLLEWVTEPPR